MGSRWRAWLLSKSELGKRNWYVDRRRWCNPGEIAAFVMPRSGDSTNSSLLLFRDFDSARERKTPQTELPKLWWSPMVIPA